jgi:hypothetical protein
MHPVNRNPPSNYRSPEFWVTSETRRPVGVSRIPKSGDQGKPFPPDGSGIPEYSGGSGNPSPLCDSGNTAFQVTGYLEFTR